jgi:hypothetical protein
MTFVTLALMTYWYGHQPGIGSYIIATMASLNIVQRSHNQLFRRVASKYLDNYLAWQFRDARTRMPGPKSGTKC